MNPKCVMLAFIGICQLMLSATFAPEEARRIYGESSSSFTSSSHEVGDYVFMKLEWTFDKDSSPEEREALELSAVMDAIEKYVAPSVMVCTNSPFSKALTTWMTPDTEFKLPEVQTSVVKDEEKDGTRCQVVAFDAVSLKAARADAAQKVRSVNARTLEDWLELLKKASENFKTEEGKRKFNTMLGCPIVNFISCRAYEKESANDDEQAGIEELAKIVDWTPREGSVYAEYPDLLWMTRKDKGAGLFYPYWSEDDGGAFAEAEKLYRQGKDIPRIIKLLAESITKNPIGVKKWSYLAGVLKVSNRYEDALIAYIQTLKLDPSNTWAWKGVMECCQKLGFKSNAVGLAWYFKLQRIR